MTLESKLSNNDKRNKIYDTFLKSCLNSDATVGDIISLGRKLMRKEKLHHHFFGNYDFFGNHHFFGNHRFYHFFGNYSLLANSKYLTYHALMVLDPKPHRSVNDKLTVQEATSIITLFEKRISERIPVEYITNEADYAGHKFYVNEHVLVPRSLMNARFNDFLNEMHWENYRVLDLCTGSGCIGITLALLNSKIQVDLADISSDALDVARTNIEKHSLSDRVKCIQSDCFENIQGKYDLIITNPPYVSTLEYNQSPIEFKNEPKIALESGADGLDIVNKILTQAQSYLNPNGELIAEVGLTAAKRLKKKHPQVHFKWLKYRRLNGKEFFFDAPGVFSCKYDQLQNL